LEQFELFMPLKSTWLFIANFASASESIAQVTLALIPYFIQSFILVLCSKDVTGSSWNIHTYMFIMINLHGSPKVAQENHSENLICKSYLYDNMNICICVCMYVVWMYLCTYVCTLISHRFILRYFHYFT
jgi:hypothetical protein